MGALVKLKNPARARSTSAYLAQRHEVGPGRPYRSIYLRSLEPRYASHRLIIPVPGLSGRGLPAGPSVKRSAVVSLNLCPLAWQPLTDQN